MNDLLDAVRKTLDERRETHGDVKENFTKIAKRWSLTLNTTVTPQQVALMMLDLKLVRLQNNPKHLDNFVDAIGYIVCLNQIVSG